MQGSTRHSILTDHLGTPLELVDQSGQRTWQAQTTAYGRIRLEAGTRAECPFRFQGQYEDVETGLYYNRFRYYDPQMGSYVSQDPIRLAGGNAVYAYVKDSSLFVDVLGWMPWVNPIRQGHHLVYQNKARGVKGLEHFATENTPTFFFNEPYTPGAHEAVHAAQRPHVGPRQGAWTGTADELLEASGKGLSHPSLKNIKGELRVISTGEVLIANASPAEAFNRLMQWHKEMASTVCS